MAAEHTERAEATPPIQQVDPAGLALAGPAPTTRSAGEALVQRSALTVGAADDPSERDADRVADAVMRVLHDSSTPALVARGTADARDGGRVRRRSDHTGSSTSQPGSASSAPRIRRSAPIGLAGGTLDAETSSAIERRRGGGHGLDGRVRRRMEHGFGADLGHLRVHAGREASSLNESMQAEAFTVGNDIFLHSSAPDLGSSSGEHLLAHEIAHTFQQSGAGRRQVRRKMMSTAAFDAATDEGWFTARSKAQKSINAMLESYHAQFPWEQQLRMGVLQATAAVGKLEEIRTVAKMWIKDHEVEVNGVTTADPSRKKRRAGMDALIVACESEMLVLRDLIQYKSGGDVKGADHDLSAITIEQPSEAFSKVKEKYEGDATSAFRKLGFIIDGAVPLDGDKASVAMEVTIPIPPGFVTLEFKSEASRDGERVEAGITVGVTGGASVGSLAKISAGVGCYLTAKAKTGADVAELMSYALFRRCRQSVAVPREFTNAMWGNGRTGDFGWVKAEQWSLGVENRILGADPEAEVSTGAYAKLAAEFEVAPDLAKLGIEVKGTSGSTINKESLERAKGGAGQRNKTSSGSNVTDGGGMRGTTQKSVATEKFGLETSGSFSFGILSGGISAEFGWSKSKMVGGKPTYQFDTFKLNANFAGDLPIGKADNPIAAAIPNYVATINQIIRTSMAAAQAETAAKSGGVIVDSSLSYAAMVADLASVPEETWQPFAANPPTAGTSVDGKVTLELAGSFDFKAGSDGEALVVQLRLGKQAGITDAINKAGKVIDVFKMDISKSSRLVKVAYKGSKWVVS